MLRTVAVTTAAVLASALGDIYMSRAMRSLGVVEIRGVGSLLHVARRVLASAAFWTAISLMAVHFFLWLSVLSWAELSVALPLTSLKYVFNAALAGPMLGETVNRLRWWGTSIIVAGIIVITLSGGR
ncbi:MAG: EamA family transporter [Candidatus Eremiobacterota bacterium]